MTNISIILIFLILTYFITEVISIQIDNEIIEELNENDIESINENSFINLNFNKDNEIDLSHLNHSIFGKPDNQTTGSILLNYNINQTINPEELGTYLEGDILIPLVSGRNGLISLSYRWPNAEIPYLIEGTFNTDELSKLRDGINQYHIKTCIRFIPRTTETDYISIVNGNSGCWSSIGKIGGRQEINLQTPGCLIRGSGTFVHELMHTIGFLHEQNRFERDDFITIKYENIDKKTIDNFVKASSTSTSAFGVPYDYGSIMHYSPYAFSINGNPTIIAKYPAVSMGQRNGFSSFDIQKINAMYKCSDTQQQTTYPVVFNNGTSNNNGMSLTSSFLTLLGLCGFFSC